MISYWALPPPSSTYGCGLACREHVLLFVPHLIHDLLSMDGEDLDTRTGGSDVRENGEDLDLDTRTSSGDVLENGEDLDTRTGGVDVLENEESAAGRTDEAKVNKASTAAAACVYIL